MNTATPSPPLKKPTPPPAMPPTKAPPSTVPKTTTTTIAKAAPTPMSDLEKELEEFDIDLDKDDVSDVETGQSTGLNKNFGDEDEVNPSK